MGVSKARMRFHQILLIMRLNLKESIVFNLVNERFVKRSRLFWHKNKGKMAPFKVLFNHFEMS